MSELRDNAIEAGAPALWAHVMADDPLIEPWHEAEPDPQRETRETVAVIYDAIEPLIRRQVAEEIAAAIEAYQVDAHPAVCPPSIAWEAGRERSAKIAREIGERHA